MLRQTLAQLLEPLQAPSGAPRSGGRYGASRQRFTAGGREAKLDLADVRLVFPQKGKRAQPAALVVAGTLRTLPAVMQARPSTPPRLRHVAATVARHALAERPGYPVRGDRERI